jgi:hypothetical protein
MPGRIWRLLTFRGTIGGRAYLIASVLVIALQHLLLEIASRLITPQAPTWAAHLSLGLILASSAKSQGLVLFPVYAALAGVSTWLLGALAFARASKTKSPVGEVILVAVPLLQVAVIAHLGLSADKAGPTTEPSEAPPIGRWTPAMQGVLVGAVLTPFAVFVGALGFGSYGWTMFALSPFLIGAVTAYLANRRKDIGFSDTLLLVLAALLLGGLSLLALALEGVVCLVVASPLILVLGVLGGVAGWQAARWGRRPVRDTVAMFSLLPLAFMIEHAIPDTTRFTSQDTIVIAAPPTAVWAALTHMGEIHERPTLLFRLGVAYPTAGVIRGEGVGAIREGHFSTGVAYERVSEWRPGQCLDFDVLSDAPSLKELSPYPHVYAPHVVGYFRTRTARFDLSPAPGGETRLTLTTTHELNLNPAAYWVPIASWIVHENRLRVLQHFRRLAEAQIAGQP